MKRLKIKNKLAAILILTPLVFSSISCKKDFLELAPELSIPVDVAWSSEKRIEAQVIGTYSSIKNGQFYGGRYLIYNDIRSEEFTNQRGNNVTGYSTYQFSNDQTDSYVADFWIRGYLTINRVNIFLEDVEKVSTEILSEEKKKQFIGEVKFIRALTYYSLIQLFAKPYAANNGTGVGIPLRLLAEKNQEHNDLAASPVKDIYAQILKDLEDAENSVPEANAGKTRAHKNAVIAYKTRVYLAMKDYPKVIAEANKIVSANAPFKSSSGASHELADDIAAVFTNFSINERILNFPFEATNAPGTQNQLGYYYNEGNIEYSLAAKGIFGNTNWPVSDERKSKLTGKSSDGKLNLLTKFSKNSPFLDWIPVLRYSEVLLNLAEAEAEAGSQTRALALLKAVRNRSDASYTFPTFASKSALVDAILLERRIEFLGEGLRVPDLQRRNMPIPSEGAGRTVQPDDERYYFPTPLVEIITNPGVNN
jgi:hypothetical protein